MANDLVEFDPEVVERFDIEQGSGWDSGGALMVETKYDGDYVRASDYDSLLSLYRELKEKEQSKCASAASE